MKNIKHYFAITAISLLVVGCAEERESDFMVEKPASTVMHNFLSSFPNLKESAADKNTNVAISLPVSDFTGKGTKYSLAINNFSAIAPTGDFSMLSRMEDGGKVNASELFTLGEAATGNGMEVFGPAILSYTGQRGKQMRELIADVYLEGEPCKDKDNVMDFEDMAIGTQLPTNGTKCTAEVVANPDGDGNVVHITTTATKAYPVFEITVPKNRKLSDYEMLSFDLYTNAAGVKAIFNTQYNDNKVVNTGLPNALACEADKWNKEKYVIGLVSKLKLTEEDMDVTTFKLTMGSNLKNADYYIDNIKLIQDHNLPGTTIVKTPEEKAAIVDSCMNVWISGIVGSSKGYVKDWTIVKDPMSDTDGELLRVGLETLAADEFYYQEYLTDNYVRNAVKHAREAAVDTAGNKVDIKLFVEEYGLNEGTKFDRLSQQIALWEADGTKIDGIYTTLHLNYYTDATLQAENETAVNDFIGKLATCGKLVRLDTSIRVVDNDEIIAASSLSEELQFAATAYFNSVIRSLKEKVGANLYALVFSAFENSNNQNIGLWDGSYNRKINYAGVSNALAGKAAPTQADVKD
ncbi:MAG: endo-1,4-beta-xylanase [Prevotella sp.]|nr:endo-1,4-beta-xylanase [Prevotella sp.]